MLLMRSKHIGSVGKSVVVEAEVLRTKDETYSSDDIDSHLKGCVDSWRLWDLASSYGGFDGSDVPHRIVFGGQSGWFAVTGFSGEGAHNRSYLCSIL